MNIPISNIYYLLCYAWDKLEEMEGLSEVGAVDSTELIDLFARVLVNGSRCLLRRGLDRGYLAREGDLAGVRGKLIVTATLRRHLIQIGRAACEWDELEYDTLPNQILKTILLRIHDASEINARTRSDVFDLLRWFAPVKPIDLRSECFRRVQLHRNNRVYALLLQICEFIHEHWLPDEGGHGRRFREFAGKGLPALFERFVFNFYRRELSRDWEVSAPTIHWNLERQNADAQSLLPRMQTDVCLFGSGRAIILDTKFYSQALKAGPYGSEKLHPGNLYQLFTYLRQRSVRPGWERAEGILLYPRTNRDFDVDMTTHGHRIRAVTVDLAQPWKQIHDALLKVVQ